MQLTNLWSHKHELEALPLPALHKLDVLDLAKVLPYVGSAPPASAPVFELQMNGEDRFVVIYSHALITYLAYFS